MKKNLWSILIGILLILTSCQNEDNFFVTNSTQLHKTRTSHFYGVKSAKSTDQVAMRGIAQRDKLWNPGTSITVKLLNDPYNMTEKIKCYASEWEKYADIKFVFVDSSE